MTYNWFYEIQNVILKCKVFYIIKVKQNININITDYNI